MITWIIFSQSYHSIHMLFSFCSVLWHLWKCDKIACSMINRLVHISFLYSSFYFSWRYYILCTFSFLSLSTCPYFLPMNLIFVLPLNFLPSLTSCVLRKSCLSLDLLMTCNHGNSDSFILPFTVFGLWRHTGVYFVK